MVPVVVAAGLLVVDLEALEIQVDRVVDLFQHQVLLNLVILARVMVAEEVVQHYAETMTLCKHRRIFPLEDPEVICLALS